MITTAIRKTVSRTFKAKPQAQLPDFAAKASIPIRHLAIGFKGKEIDLSFYMNNQFATLFFATLSVFLTNKGDSTASPCAICSRCCAKISASMSFSK
jgi:hypothetical protein